MPFTLIHTLVTEQIRPTRQALGAQVSFTVHLKGTFEVLYPGALHPGPKATVHTSYVAKPLPGVPNKPGEGVLHGGRTSKDTPMSLTLAITDPHGQPFTRTEITLADLEKYRDLRGQPTGQWSYVVSGQSTVQAPDETQGERASATGALNIGLVETVASASAPPLVPPVHVGGEKHTYQFDLNRVGTFVASLTGAVFPGPTSLQLLDPDGAVAGTANATNLSVDISLAKLAKSRDAVGNVRPWTLNATIPSPPLANLPQPSLTATVVAQGRIATQVIRDRLQFAIGTRGASLEIVGVNDNGKAQAILVIKDALAAETLDMYSFLKSRLAAAGQSTDLTTNEALILYQTASDLDYGFSVDVSTFRVNTIDVDFVMASNGSGAACVKLTIATQGQVNVQWERITAMSAKPRNDQIVLEVGILVDPDGTPRAVSYLADDALDLSLSAAAIASIIVTAGTLIAIGAEGIKKYLQDWANETLVAGMQSFVADPNLASEILLPLLGAHFTYLPPRIENGDLFLAHYAAVEPDLRHNPGYTGAIGRGVTKHSGAPATFTPPAPVVTDTWAAPNLKSKIDHIVVVMMENRSYDHVLGYRARPPWTDNKDGMTAEVMAAVTAAVTPDNLSPGIDPVHALRTRTFASNAVKLKTHFSKPVGHELADVTEQLSKQASGAGGTTINNPSGFLSDFAKKFTDGALSDSNNYVRTDVLGYYETNPGVTDPNTAAPVDDLPMYAFLAKNYAYSDRYFSSHPGPTLPNRMYSLTGDLQHDRLGVPILDSNHGEDVILSRATTIYDVLARHGVSWRVYESAPSVTMLRMFARYVTDDVNIRPLAELEAAFGPNVPSTSIPSVVVIEPQMHAAPEDDDHPPYDMYRGQMFVQRVYNALTQNPERWNRTLLLVTYDEHGGFYDHVVPPAADVMEPVSRTPTAGETVAPGAENRLPKDAMVERKVAAGSAAQTLARPPTAGQVALGDPPSPSLVTNYGVRVPTFVVSPQVPADAKPDLVLDHCSILKTILARFCSDTRPFLSDRVNASNSFEAFVSAPAPRPSVGPAPNFPRLDVTGSDDVAVSPRSKITTPPLYRSRLRTEQVDYHDISGRLARSLLGR